MASSSACAPTERRSVATSVAPPTPAATITGTQLLKKGDAASAAASAYEPIVLLIVSKQRGVDRIAQAMNDQEMDFLDPHRAGMRHAHMDVFGDEKFTGAPAALAGQRDDTHLAFMGGDDGRDDVRRVAGRRYGEKNVALGAERAHLLGEHLLERVVVCHRGQQRHVGDKRNRG